MLRYLLTLIIYTNVSGLTNLRENAWSEIQMGRMLRLTEYFGRSRSFGSVRFGELRDSAEASAEYSVLFGVEISALCLLLFMSYNSNFL